MSFSIALIFASEPAKSENNIETDIATVKEALSIVAPAYGWQFVWAANEDVKTGEVTIRRNMNFIGFVHETLRGADHTYYAIVCDIEKLLVITDEPPIQLNSSCRLLSAEGSFI